MERFNVVTVEDRNNCINLLFCDIKLLLKKLLKMIATVLVTMFRQNEAY